MKEVKKQRSQEAEKQEKTSLGTCKSYWPISASCIFSSFLFYIFASLFLCLFASCIFSACSSQMGKDRRKVCFYDRCVKAELARTQEERGRGLQFRRSLGHDEGMLFVFPSSHPQGFWMKDTLIPLDIIWMDRHKRIVFIAPSVLPCETEPCPVYMPDTAADYVLEVNAGVAAQWGLRPGDQAVF